MNPQDLVTSMETYLATINPAVIVQNVLVSLLIFIGFRLLQRPILRLVEQRVKSVEDRYRWQKIIRYWLTAIMVVLIAGIWLEGIAQLATILAIVAAGLAIVLRDPIVDIGGWAYIIWRKPFEVGHRVTIMGQRGDVIDLGVFVFSMMEVGDGLAGPRQSTGRVIQMPNMHIFTQSLTNENIAFDFIWHEVAVVVTFESDWRRAKEILQEIVTRQGGDLVEKAEAQMQKASNQYLVKMASLTPTVYTRVVDYGIELSMRFLSEVRQPRAMEAAIWEDVLAAVATEPAIDLAYPTSRVVRTTEEGKINTAREDPAAELPV